MAIMLVDPDLSGPAQAWGAAALGTSVVATTSTLWRWGGRSTVPRLLART
jgi:hypothetical protein